MTKADMDREVAARFNRYYPLLSDISDFVLEMVREHNEEMAQLAADHMEDDGSGSVGLAIADKIREACPK